jgi:hypothetical protein
MTIQLARAIRIDGVETAAGTTLTRDPAFEADLIYKGIATRVGAAPDQVGLGVPVTARTNTLTGGIGIIGPDGSQLFVVSASGKMPSDAHSRYYCHLYAGDQVADDGVVYDQSGALSHAVRGANLSVANLWVSSGYFSTDNPASGTPDSGLVMPPLNYDYNGGEELLLVWLGKITPEAAAATMLSDSPNSAGLNGFRLRCQPTGKFSFWLQENGSTNAWAAGDSSTVLGDGALHQYAILISGKRKQYWTWEDGVAVVTAGAIKSGAAIDTRTSSNVYIGKDASTSGVEAIGLATKTRALTMLRFSAADPQVDVAKAFAVVKALRASPAQLVKQGAM